jgi:hypothetical protein
MMLDTQMWAKTVSGYLDLVLRDGRQSVQLLRGAQRSVLVGRLIVLTCLNWKQQAKALCAPAA